MDTYNWQFSQTLQPPKSLMLSLASQESGELFLEVELERKETLKTTEVLCASMKIEYEGHRIRTIQTELHHGEKVTLQHCLPRWNGSRLALPSIAGLETHWTVIGTSNYTARELAKRQGGQFLRF